MIIPVLLSGGVGSRLWPVSREQYPKQFIPLVEENTSMLQSTYLRTALIEKVSPIVVCNEAHRFLVAEQLRSAGAEHAKILLEPCGRNTAPAAALAALCALEQSSDAMILLLPADHVILDAQAFADAVAVGKRSAADGKLVTFGIKPSAPETGYGYIKGGVASGDALAVDRFVEKPDAATAAEYIASGDYFWNSGMFLFKADVYLAELERTAPAIYSTVREAFEKCERDLDFLRVDNETFSACPEDSIDYAVMEHTDNAVVIPVDCGWSDVGSWSSLWEVGHKDDGQNVTHGDVVLEGVKNSLVHSESRLTAVLGLDDVIVVETADAVLVADKGEVQNIKKIVKRLKGGERDEAFTHKEVFRPWGSYESLVVDERFQVKRIVVNPGHTLSLQMHHHRAEHWIVVKGTAVVTCGDNEFILGEDQSTYIPLGNKHRLANPGVIPLEIIEVQTGSYLGEDDIVRFEDVYGR